jgi:hypothetical protein
MSTNQTYYRQTSSKKSKNATIDDSNSHGSWLKSDLTNTTEKHSQDELIKQLSRKINRL